MSGGSKSRLTALVNLVGLSPLDTRAARGPWGEGPIGVKGPINVVKGPTEMTSLCPPGPTSSRELWGEAPSLGQGSMGVQTEPIGAGSLCPLGTRAKRGPSGARPIEGEGLMRRMVEPKEVFCLSLLGTRASRGPWKEGLGESEGLKRGLDGPVEVMMAITGPWGSWAGLAEPSGLDMAMWATRLSLSVATVGAATLKRHVGCCMGCCMGVWSGGVKESCMRGTIEGCMANVMTLGVLLVCQVASCSCGCRTYILRGNS